jgi:hypothetical protein
LIDINIAFADRAAKQSSDMTMPRSKEHTSQNGVLHAQLNLVSVFDWEMQRANAFARCRAETI